MLPDQPLCAQIPTDLVPLGRAATTLHCNRATVYRWVLAGKIRSWRQAGNRFMVSLADVRELMQPVRQRSRDVSAKAEESRQDLARRGRTQEVLRRHGLA
jgi:excisionase family DNA binding protein